MYLSLRATKSLKQFIHDIKNIKQIRFCCFGAIKDKLIQTLVNIIDTFASEVTFFI